MTVDETSIVECILNRRTYENGVETSHLDSMYRRFCENAEKGEAEKLDMYGKSELQRVLNVKEFFEWIPVPETYFKRFEKSSKLSSIFRTKGNESYLAEEYENALRAYNLAIGFAKRGESELGLAYEKRADLFLTLNEPDLAQRDINLAAANAYPKRAAQKLIELQNRCAIAANKKNLSLQNSNKRINDAKRVCNEKFFRLKTPHPNIQNVEDFVEIDYRSECGRRVIVTRDVPAGTVMLVDSPYAFILEHLSNWDTEHCHQCTKPILGGIPCHSCTFAWFCSDSCFAKAANGIHRYEHKYLPYLHCHPMACRIITSARVLFTTGSDELLRIFRTKDPLYFSSPKSGAKRGFNNNGIYEVNSYLPIYHLISHPPSKFVKDVADVFKAMHMTHLIDQTTNFFQKLKFKDCEEREVFKDFIASLFLRHMRSFEFNAITLSKLEQRICPDPNNNPMTGSSNEGPTLSHQINMKTVRYGAAVYPVLCLLNHSCDPNSVPVRSLKFSKTSVVAMKNLKRGDEITISYTPSFISQNTQERLQYLMERYNFYCTCEACNHNWSKEKITNQFGESYCDKCHRYLLTGQCPACAKRDKNMPIFIQYLQKEAERAERLMEKQEFIEAEEIIASSLQQCTDFSPCFRLFIEMQQLYKRALVGLFNQ